MTKRKGLPTTAPESHLTHIIAQKGGIQDMVEQALDIELAGPLAKGQINVFVAESGKGKSLLAFIVAWKELQTEILIMYSIWIWITRTVYGKTDTQTLRKTQI